MDILKVYVVGRAWNYAEWLADRVVFVKNIHDCDLVLFTGGEDVYPKLYHEKDNRHTSYGEILENVGMPFRDFFEQQCYKEALLLKKPMFGVCRGIQFLTVMNGGKLIQHVNRHAGADHDITWFDGDVTLSTSLHHQMCYPFNLQAEDYQLLAWSSEIRGTTHQNGNGDEVEIEKEPEVLYFPKTKCLGVQGHPEMHVSYQDKIHIKLRQLISTLLLSQLPSDEYKVNVNGEQRVLG